MSDFLARLVQRQWGQIPTIQPRLPSVFTPVMDQMGFQETEGGIDTTAPLIKGQTPQVTLERQWVREPERPKSDETLLTSRAFQPMVESHSVNRLGTEAPKSPRVSDATPLVDVQSIQRTHVTEMPRMSAQRQINDEGIRTQPQTRPHQDGRGEESLHPVPSDIAGSMAIPRLAEPRVRNQARTPQQAEAPRSLVGAGSSAERAQNIPPTLAESPVQVTIGRIEVTAVTQAAPAKRAATPRKPTMSLDEYLARRRRRES
jgi:hypothetical protein